MIIFVLFFSVLLFSIESGIPFIRNYSLAEYNLQPQNWCIKQDKRGIIYVGNHGGLLEYDGSEWRIIEIPNWTVRSMAFDNAGTLFIGGNDEIGYISFPLREKPEFVSLTGQLKKEDQGFGNIWRIVRSGEDLYFWASPKIFKWNGKKLTVWKKGLACRGIYKCRDDLYIHLRNEGLKKFEGDKIVPVPGGDRFGNNKINSVLPYEDNRLLIITKKEGLFISSGESFIKFETEADELFSTHIPYYGIRLSSGEYAIGTKKGVFIINRSGNLISLLDKKSGMNNDNIKILFEDKERNIWVGLNVGISKIEYSSPFRVMDSRMKLTGMVLSIKKSGNSIYVGTSTGLFRYNKNSFSKIEGVEASCWDIMDLNGKVIFASSSGLYTLEDNRFNRESSVRIYKLFRSRNYTENIWAGTIGGVSRLDIINNSIALIPVPGINTEIRSLVEDREGILWAGSPTNGVFRLVPGENEEITDLKNYYINDGLPGKETHVFLINGKAVFATAKGLYKFIESEKRFEPDDILGDEFCDGSTSIFYIHEDNSGRLWIHSANRNYSAEKNSKGTYDIAEKIFLRMPERQVNSILRNGNVIWFGTIEGITKFDTQYEKKYQEGTRPLLRRMTINGDKIIYKGLEINEEDAESSFLFSPDCRNIKFEYSSPFYEAEDKTKFRCKLEGSGEEFSEWSDKNFKEFYNLTFGYYRFIVEARNVYGDISSSSVFQFKIEPPWYWKWWIFPFYFLLIAGSIYIIVLWRSSALLKEKKELEKTIAERTIELREKSVKLEEMDRIKSRFFANISHEFRTPLTLINGPLEDMITESNNAGEAERLRQMLNNSNKLLALINQLLDLSKLESGQMKLDRRPDDIVVFLKGIISSFEHPAKQKKILLLLSTSQEEIITSFDRNKLENVFTNLLANAIKFTEEGGKISINITVLKADNKDQKYIKIILTDTGKGIPENELDRIFDRFYQAENETGGGTGIGLAIAKELIELHGGEISAGNNKPAGTVFTVTFPLTEEDGNVPEKIKSQGEEEIVVKPDSVSMAGIPSEEDPECENEEKSSEKKTILIIDDNYDIREYIVRILYPEFIIEVAENGEEGIRKAGEVIPDLILCDVMMPVLDGFEACRRLKNNIKTSHIPVIFLTAKAEESDQIEGLEHGADDYIVKPFNSKILLSRIRNLIDLRTELQSKIRREMALKPSEIKVTSMDMEFLNEFKSVIEENLSDPLLDIGILTKKMFMGRSTLFRKVEGLTGVSPMQFVRSYRLQRGVQLLKQGYGTITQISLEVGFTSPAYFTKCFKEEFHQLPSGFNLTDEKKG